MRIAFVGDSIRTIKTVIRCIKTLEEKMPCRYKIFSNSFHLLEELEHNIAYDIYLLDIDMLQSEGINLARSIRKSQKWAYIVLLSSGGQYAVESYSFQVRAFHYILKEHISEQLPDVLKFIQEEMDNQNDGFFMVRTKGELYCLKKKDVFYVYKEKNGKNIVFVTENGEYKERGTLKDALEILAAEYFIMAGKSCIINMAQVRGIMEEQIFFKDKTVYISSHSCVETKKKVAEYWKNKDIDI